MTKVKTDNQAEKPNEQGELTHNELDSVSGGGAAAFATWNKLVEASTSPPTPTGILKQRKEAGGGTSCGGEKGSDGRK